MFGFLALKTALLAETEVEVLMANIFPQRLESWPTGASCCVTLGPGYQSSGSGKMIPCST